MVCTWPKRILTVWQERRKGRGRPEMKWAGEVERVRKQKNLTSDEAVNRQTWPKVIRTSNRRIMAKLL